MKIGIVCPYNIFKGGGVQECVLAISDGLKKRGHQVAIITPYPRGYTGETPDGVIFLGASTDMKSPLHTTVQVSATGNRDRITEILEHEQFDVLNFHEPWVPMISRQILTKSSAVNVGTFHAKLPDTRMSKTIERVITPYTKSIMKYIDGITAVSPAAADYVKQLSSIPVQYVANGIDLTKYKPGTPGTSSIPTVLYIGRLEKRKGVKYLLRAFAQLQAGIPEARLIIAGDGPDREKLEEYVHSQHLQHVSFLGYITEQKKLELLQSATVFCSPALYGESFGIVLLEAMACGIPIVAGDNPGYAAVMKETGKLSIVDPKSTDEFARRLELLLTDTALRATWKTWAKTYVKQFDYPRIVDGYEMVFMAARKKHD